jgi:hypothetical protein
MALGSGMGVWVKLLPDWADSFIDLLGGIGHILSKLGGILGELCDIIEEAKLLELLLLVEWELKAINCVEDVT